MKKRKFFLSILSFLLIFATIFPQGSLFAKAEGEESSVNNMDTYSENYSEGGTKTNKIIDNTTFEGNVQNYFIGKNITKNGDGTWTVTIGMNNVVNTTKNLYSTPTRVDSDIIFVFGLIVTL